MARSVEGSVAGRAVVGAGWLFAWRALTRTLGFISTLVLARLLTPADFGLVAMAGAFEATIDGLSQFGLSDLLLRRPQDDTRLHDVVFTLQVVRAVTIGGLIALAAPIASAWFSEPRLTPVLWVLAILAAAAGLENIGPIEFRRDLRYERQVQILAVPRFLQLVVTIAVAWYTRSYWALLAGIAITRLSRVVMTYAMHPYRPRLSLAGWQEVAGFSFWMWAASIAQLVWERAPTFIVGRAFGSAGLGLYRISGDLALLPESELVAPVADVLLTSLALLERTGSRGAASILPVASALLALVAPFAISLSAGAGFAVELLLGAKWVAGQPLVAMSAWICLLAPFSYACNAVMIAQGRVRRRFFGSALAVFVQTAIIYAAAQSHQLTVVVGGWVISVCIATVGFVLILAAYQPLGLRAHLGGLIRIGLAGLGAIAAVSQTGLAWLPASYFAARSIRPVQALLSSLVIGGTVCTVFASVLLVLWHIAGRPGGPERLLLQTAGNLAHRMRPIGGRHKQA